MEKTILVGTGVSVGSATNPTNVPEGAIAIFNAETGALVGAGDTVDDAPFIFIVRGVAAGQQPVISPVIDVRKTRKWAGTAYQAPARHVITAGFTGSGTLAIPVVNNGEYTVILKELSSNFEPFPTLVKTITADANATGYEVAHGLARLINADAASRAWAEVLVDVPATALTNSATITTVNGSNVVTVSAAPDAPAVGAFLRIGGTAATNGVYRVVGVAGTIVTLDRAYVNPAQTFGQTVAAVAAATLNAAPAAGDEAGLRFTAKEFGFVLSAAFDGAMVGVPFSATTAFVNGIGRGVQVQKREKQLQGSQANYNRVWLTQPTLEQTNPALNYDAYQIAYTRHEEGAIPTSVETLAHEVIIYMNTSASTQKTALKNILNPLFASTALQFPNVTV